MKDLSKNFSSCEASMEPVLENNFVLSSATLLGLSLIFGVGPLSFLYELACGFLLINETVLQKERFR